MERSEFHALESKPDPSPASMRLAVALAGRLHSILPDPFRASPKGGQVSFYHGDEWYGSMDVAGVIDQVIHGEDADDERWSFEGRAAIVACNSLSSAQDIVATVTTEPWPRLPTGGMAVPGTRTEAGQVFLWYGPDWEREAQAVLVLPPLLLDEMSRG